jgi:hypothetical protein
MSDTNANADKAAAETEHEDETQTEGTETTAETEGALDDVETEESSDVETPRDAKDEMIERLTRMIEAKDRALTQPREAAREEPAEDPIEEEARKLGFGNVGYKTDAEGNVIDRGVNMIPQLTKLLAVQRKLLEESVGAAVGPRLDALGNEIVGTKFQRELAIRIPRQTPDFKRFVEAEIARDGKLAQFSKHPEGADVAADMIELRWRKKLRAVKKGEDRRQERASGAGLQSGAPRGSGSSKTSKVVKLSRTDPDFARKFDELAKDPSVDLANIKITR